MALEIRQLHPDQPDAVGAMVADRELCLSADGRLVEAGALDSVRLLAGPEHVLTPEQIHRYRLVVVDGRVMQQPVENGGPADAPVMTAPVDAPTAAPPRRTRRKPKEP